jgi:hypothetical protein
MSPDIAECWVDVALSGEAEGWIRSTLQATESTATLLHPGERGAIEAQWCGHHQQQGTHQDSYTRGKEDLERLGGERLPAAGR